MLMRDILVAVDGSSDADAAVDAAVLLARRGDATVHVLHVVPLATAFGKALGGLPRRLTIDQLPSLPEGVADDAGLEDVPVLRSATARLTTAGVRAIPRVEYGPAPGWILSHARDKDILLLGRRGKGGKSLGSVIDPVVKGVLDETNIPLAIIGAPFGGKIERPLLAYDGRAGSHAALSPALDLCQSFGVPLTILHLPGYAPKESLDHVRKHLEGSPAGAFRWVDADGTKGSVERVLEALAGYGHDLLLLGPTGYQDEGNQAPERPVEALLRRANTPVIVLR